MAVGRRKACAPLVGYSDILGLRLIEPGSIKFDQVHACVHTLMCTRLFYARSHAVVQRLQCLLLSHTAQLQHAVLASATAALCDPVHLCSRCGLVRTIYAYICDMFMSGLAAVPRATVPPVAVP